MMVEPLTANCFVRTQRLAVTYGPILGQTAGCWRPDNGGEMTSFTSSATPWSPMGLFGATLCWHKPIRFKNVCGP